MQSRVKWNADKVIIGSQEIPGHEYQDLLAELWQILLSSKRSKDAQRVKLSSQVACPQKRKGKGNV